MGICFVWLMQIWIFHKNIVSSLQNKIMCPYFVSIIKEHHIPICVRLISISVISNAVILSFICYSKDVNTVK